jgi:hypothetical protein
MELFTENTRTYKTRANAERRATRALCRYPEGRYVIGSTADGRYFPVFIGRETFDLVHDGYCVAS